MNLPQGEVQFGKTKLFVRSPRTLFDIEEERLRALHRVATKIQKVWRAWRIRKVYLELKREAMDIFHGMKERTRTSVARGAVAFFGDFLGLKENVEVNNLIRPNGDTKIVFSEVVKKVNRRDKIQDRILLLTEKSIYNLIRYPKPKKGLFFEIKRRIPYESVTGVSVSRLSDNFFVVHVPSEYDYVYESPKKTVFITLFNNEYKNKVGHPIQVNVVESIQYKLKKGTKQIEFKKDEMQPQGQLKKGKGKLMVSIASGVPEDQLRKS